MNVSCETIEPKRALASIKDEAIMAHGTDSLLGKGSFV
jgi:hypothetical protein